MASSGCNDILLQVKSAEKVLQKDHHLLLDEVYSKALAIQIVHAVKACPGNCGNEDKIEALRQRFPALDPDTEGKHDFIYF